MGVCLPHAHISEDKRDAAVVTMKHEYEIDIPDNESVIRFATGSTRSPLWAFSAAIWFRDCRVVTNFKTVT